MANEFLAKALRDARVKAKVSQEEMAFQLMVARKTVQNWEKGVSEPTIEQAIEWYRVLHVSPLPDLFQYVFPDMREISGGDADATLRKALTQLVQELPAEGMRQLLYLFYGDHGSSPRAVLNMVTAHLQTPMRDRVTAGSVNLKNYEIAEKKKQLTDTEHVQPNLDVLRAAIEKGEQAAVQDDDAYIL